MQREEAINTMLASVLEENELIPGVAELRVRGTQSTPDVLVKPTKSSLRGIIIEAKKGTTQTNKDEALRQAASRLGSHWNVFAAFGLCYPDSVTKDARVLKAKLLETDELLFAQVYESGRTSNWNKGSLSNFASALRTAESGHDEITTKMNEALEKAASTLENISSKEIAQVLNISMEMPKNKRGGGNRVIKIGLLLILNSSLLLARLEDHNVISVGALSQCLDSDSSILRLLQEKFNKVLEIDYAPIFEPALKVLRCLPAGPRTQQALKILVETAIDVAPRAGELRLDYAGPLYHKLLPSSSLDGSFYTSTPAAILLSRLAMTADLMDWNNADKISNLKIIDPACGTGTLLMAVAAAIRDRHIKAAGGNTNVAEIHLNLVEKVLHGYDINQHAIHLAACMLTIGAPHIKYDHLNLEVMDHGVFEGPPKAGSIEFLDRSNPYLPIPEFTSSARKITAQGTKIKMALKPVKNQFDLVIMNPPFTRNSIRNDQYSKTIEDAISARELEIKENLASIDPEASNVIDHTSIRTFFTPIAELMTKLKTGTLAKVMPCTATSSASGKNERRFLARHFFVETIITTHDPKRIFFSENTEIHECLLIARRSTKKPSSTKFISLTRNPATTLEALELAETILDPNRTVSEWGTSIEWPYERMLQGDWSAALFYDGYLAEVALSMENKSILLPLGNIATLSPDGRAIRGSFHCCTARQSPDYRALWRHQTNERTTMNGEPDTYIKPKNGHDNNAKNLWEKRGNLLIANRIWLNLCRTVAVFSSEPCLGSAFIPVHPHTQNDNHTITKGWCVWANSTLGILGLLRRRQKKLTYPNFSLAGLRSLPFPDPSKCDLNPLAEAWEKNKDKVLLPFPEMANDPIRASLDEVCGALVGMKPDELSKLRKIISQEPTVCNKRATIEK